jgi:hypothetical protein
MNPAVAVRCPSPAQVIPDLKVLPLKDSIIMAICYTHGIGG